MVLPLIGLGLSAAGAVGGLMSARAGADAAATSNDIAMRNYLQQRRLAMLQEEMAQAGTVNARGDRTQYVPGVGWVERPSERTRSIIDASDNEERLRLALDAPRSRARREDNAVRQRREGQVADSILAGLNVGRETPDELRAALIERNIARAVSGADDMRRRIGMQGLRTGQMSEQTLAQLGRNRIADRRTAIAEARVDAPEMFQERRANRVNPRLNQYNVMASRASAPDDVPYQPTQLAENLAGVLRSRMNMAPQAIGSAMNVDTPRIQSTESRMPVALDSLGQFLRSAGTQGQRNNWWGLGGGSRTAGNADWRGSVAPNVFF